MCDCIMRTLGAIILGHWAEIAINDLQGIRVRDCSLLLGESLHSCSFLGLVNEHAMVYDIVDHSSFLLNTDVAPRMFSTPSLVVSHFYFLQFQQDVIC
jgi:hypothetical protein